MAPRRNAAVSSLLALILALLGVLLTLSGVEGVNELGRLSYDLLQSLQPAGRASAADCPVLLVYLDVDSHRELHQDPAGRWDRRLHAKLVRRLTQAGARAIVFDMIFDSPSADPAVDADFASAIRAHGRVVLGAERRRGDQAVVGLPSLQVHGLDFPTAVLGEAAMRVGAAELAVDEDFVVRRMLRHVEDLDRPGLAWATAEALGLSAGLGAPSDSGEWMRYYGGAAKLPYVSYRNALDPSALEDAVFRDKVVMVGARPMVGVFRERRDELRHPLSFWGDPDSFMPGIEVHATQLLNWMRRESLRRLSARVEVGITLAFAVVAAGLLIRLRPLAGAGMALGLVLASAVLAAWLWSFHGVWFSWLVPAAVIVPAGWSVSIVHHGIDWQRQRRRLEAQRREDQRKIERQAALIDKAQDLIVVADLEGRLTYLNPAARRLFQSGGMESSGATEPVPLWIPDFAEKRGLLLSTGEWSGSFEFAQSAGGCRLIESRWTLIRDDAGEPEGMLLIGSDVTEKHRLELDFLRAQKWEAVGSLAGGMAHDLNNRLAPALLGLQLLGESETDDQRRRMLSTVESHTRRGADTVRQVLRFLRGSTVEFSDLNPAELIRELESMLRDSLPKTVRVACLIAPNVGRVRGNATQLQQALLNLCLNARDAMPEGGELTLAVDDVDLSEAEAAALRGGRPGAYVLFAVSDSGSGIEPGHLGRIFDPLFTTKPEGLGTGLGLPSVARAVEQHQGCLGVTSELGHGSTFEIYLPRQL